MTKSKSSQAKSVGGIEKEEKSAIEKRLERFMNDAEPMDDGKPLPVAASIELLKRDREVWVNTLKHNRDLYSLACNVKDERRKSELWDEALRCMKWKEELDRKIVSLSKQLKSQPVEVTEGNPVIEG